MFDLQFDLKAKWSEVGLSPEELLINADTSC